MNNRSVVIPPLRRQSWMPANDVARNDVEPLFSALEELLAIEDSDALVRRAIELGRDIIGLVRPSIKVLDQFDREVFRPGEEGAPYLVFEGRFACTPVRCGNDIVGVMTNDGDGSNAAFDEVNQARAAVLCSVLGTALGSLARTRSRKTARTDGLPTHRLLMASVAMVVQDPRLTVQQIARRLAAGAGRLDQLFEANVGVCLAEYRTRVRLDRLALLIAKGHMSLPDAAVAAGFATFTQFQQVSRAFRWMTLFRQLPQ